MKMEKMPALKSGNKNSEQSQICPKWWEYTSRLNMDHNKFLIWKVRGNWHTKLKDTQIVLLNDPEPNKYVLWPGC